MRPGQEVYFLKPVGMDGPIKIGCAYEPRARLGVYEGWSPLRLELVATTPGDCHLERNIHECFLDSHSHREWFHASPRLLEFIEGIKAGKTPAECVDLNNRLGNIRSRKLADAAARVGTSQESVAL